MQAKSKYLSVKIVAFAAFFLILALSIYTLSVHLMLTRQPNASQQIIAEHDEYIQGYEKKAHENPSEPLAYYELGLAYKKAHDDSWCDPNNKYKQLAIAAFQKAIELDPEYGPAFFELGEFCSRDSQYRDKGVQLLQKAVSLMPENADVNHHLGLAYGFYTYDQVFLPSYGEYMSQKELAESKGEDTWELQQKREQELAEMYSENIYVQKAIEIHHKTLSIDPNYINAHEALIKWYAKINKPENAAEHFEALQKCGEKGRMRAEKFQHMIANE